MLELPLQHARQLLLLSAFGYRLLAWLHAPQNTPPLAAPLVPPAPPPPPLAPGKTAPITGACAQCSLSPIEQPTVAPSGFVFCGRCITAAVRRDGRCPVTGMLAGLPELLRLYETSRPPEG
jgi:peroxin-12